MTDLIILGGSFVAVALMVAFAAWARIARPTAALDEGAARGLFGAEFPDRSVESVWLAADGAGAVARSGDRALVVYRLGDSWVARDLAWDKALAAPVKAGRAHFRLGDVAAPVARLAVSGVNPWPPQDHSSSKAA